MGWIEGLEIEAIYMYLGRTESTLHVYACVWLCPISGEWAGEAMMHMRNCHNYDIRTTTPQIE